MLHGFGQVFQCLCFSFSPRQSESDSFLYDLKSLHWYVLFILVLFTNFDKFWDANNDQFFPACGLDFLKKAKGLGTKLRLKKIFQLILENSTFLLLFDPF